MSVADAAKVPVPSQSAIRSTGTDSPGGPGYVDQLVRFVIADDQRLEMPAAKTVAADHELLRAINTHLALRAGTLAGCIGAVQALGDDP